MSEQKRLFYVPLPFLPAEAQEGQPLAERMSVTLRSFDEAIDAVYSAIYKHIAEYCTEPTHAVVDVLTYLSIKYQHPGRAIDDSQMSCGRTKILCGHTTSDKPAVLLVAGENDSIRLLRQAKT